MKRLRRWETVYLGENPTIEEVSAAVNEFTQIFPELVLFHDFTALESILDEVTGIDVSKYTPSSVENLNDVYLDAYLVHADGDLHARRYRFYDRSTDDAIASLTFVADFSTCTIVSWRHNHWFWRIMMLCRGSLSYGL